MVENQPTKQLTRNVIGTIVACGMTAVILREMGQPPWCSCGSLVPWSWDIWSSHNSQHAIDPYTFTHVLHGVILCGILFLSRRFVSDRIAYLLAIVIESCWEILENSPIVIERYRQSTISLTYSGDSVTNSVFDILACAVGFLIARRIGWKWALALFVITEVLLVLTIRDCLLLNVLMLVYPVEAILQWQMFDVNSMA